MSPAVRCKKSDCHCKCKKEKPANDLVIGINGFGRIGRLVARCCLDRGIRVAQINEPFMEPDYIAYNLVHDSVHGRFGTEVVLDGRELVVGEKRIQLTGVRDPAEIDWCVSGVNLVVEATGLFTLLDSAKKHKALDASNSIRVLITAPSADCPMFVMGVNHAEYAAEQTVVSNASCTTNCLAPLAKIVNDAYGIEQGLMTTIHSYTATQKTVDGPSMKDWRGGRAGALNIIPSSTGAAKAVGAVIPELAGKLTGMALRIPTANVSVVDLTVRLVRGAPYSEVIETIKQRSEACKGIVGVVDESVVSRDFVGDTRSCIVDAEAGLQLNDKFMKLVAWYDNEFAYSNRVVDLAIHIHSVAAGKQ